MFKNGRQGMADTATANFTVTAWEEQPFDGETNGVKITQALVSKSYNGSINGMGSVIYIMNHASDGTATFIGLQQINGTLNEKNGSFAIEQTGSFDGKEVQGTFIVKEGSGTGELSTISGKGTFIAPIGKIGTLQLEFDL